MPPLSLHGHHHPLPAGMQGWIWLGSRTNLVNSPLPNLAGTLQKKWSFHLVKIIKHQKKILLEQQENLGFSSNISWAVEEPRLLLKPPSFLSSLLVQVPITSVILYILLLFFTFATCDYYSAALECLIFRGSLFHPHYAHIYVQGRQLVYYSSGHFFFPVSSPSLPKEARFKVSHSLLSPLSFTISLP